MLQQRKPGGNNHTATRIQGKVKIVRFVIWGTNLMPYEANGDALIGIASTSRPLAPFTAAWRVTGREITTVLMHGMWQNRILASEALCMWFGLHSRRAMCPRDETDAAAR